MKNIPVITNEESPPVAATGLPESSRQCCWRVPGICVLLVILVVAAFGQTLRHEFVYDDTQYLHLTPKVCDGLSFEGLRWAFTHIHAGNWHPLTTLSHMADCRLYGLEPFGHHLSNIALHATAVVLLFLMLREMTGALWRSGFVAAVFAIHPLRVESVAWVAERKDVLSGVFFMLTLWAYARYVSRPESRGRYVMLVVWFTLGLLSKPMLVTIPFLLLVLDYWPLGRLREGRHFSSLLWEKLPLVALSAFSCLATLWAQEQAIQVMRHVPLSERVGNSLLACCAYLGKMIYPANLAVLYPISKNGWPAWQVMAALVLLLALTAGAWGLRRTRPYLLAGWLWYLGMLVPVIGIVQVGLQAYADRYTYLPQIGLCLAGTWAVAEWASPRRHRRVALGGSAGLVLAVLLAMAHQQASYWRDSLSLWTHTLGCTQDNCIAHLSLGVALSKNGQNEAALAEYRECLRINPVCTDAQNNLGTLLLHLGRTDEAIAHYQAALRIDPAHAVAHNNLANALLTKGRVEEAIAEFGEALRTSPNNAKTCLSLGNALLNQGRTKEALVRFRQAVKITPDYAAAHVSLGAALTQLGQAQEAMAHFGEALRIDPAYADAHYDLGCILLQLGRTDEAVARFRTTLQINPSDGAAQLILGSTLLQQGRTEEAIAQMRKALELEPANGSIQNDLAWMLATAAQVSLRDGAMAVQLAIQATQSSGGGNPLILETLAAAYAEAGRFTEAAQTARHALQLAQAQSNTALAEALRSELQLYEAGQRFHEGP